MVLLTDSFGYGLVDMELNSPEHNVWFVSEEILNRRGYRVPTYKEMMEIIFWKTHHKKRRGVFCIHAKSPCGLFWPEELRSAVPVTGNDKLQNDLQVSMVTSDPSVSCKLWNLYVEKAVKPFLNQMHDACNCSGNAGDHVHTGLRPICD